MNGGVTGTKAWSESNMLKPEGGCLAGISWNRNFIHWVGLNSLEIQGTWPPKVPGNKVTSISFDVFIVEGTKSITNCLPRDDCFNCLGHFDIDLTMRHLVLPLATPRLLYDTFGPILLTIPTDFVNLVLLLPCGALRVSGWNGFVLPPSIRLMYPFLQKMCLFHQV